MQPIVPATGSECDDISPKRRDLIMAQVLFRSALQSKGLYSKKSNLLMRCLDEVII